MNKLLFYLSSITIYLGLIPASNANEVTVSGRQILLNGTPYLIKGICYQPVPKGSTTVSWETLTQDLELMNEAEDDELLYSDPFYWGPFILNGTRI
jgi:hypothetical protein